MDIHPEAAELKTHRVRAYQDVKILQNCPVDEVKMTNVLVIDNVTEADSGTYQCTGYMSIPTPWPVLRSSSMFVEVNPGTYIELNTACTSSMFGPGTYVEYRLNWIYLLIAILARNFILMHVWRHAQCININVHCVLERA